MTDASGAPGQDPPEPTTSPSGGPVPDAGPPPALGVPTAGPAPYAQLPYGHTPYHQNPYGPPVYGMPGYGAPLRDPDARPGTVLAAAVVTFVTSGLAVVGLAVLLLAMLVARNDVVTGIRQELVVDDGTAGAVYSVALVVVVLMILWAIASLVLGVLVLKRKNWARIGLVVSASVTVLASLVTIATGGPLVTLAAGIVVIVCLFTGGAGDWFRREHLYSPPRMPPL